MENKERETIYQEVQELIAKYSENFKLKGEFKKILNILATTQDEDFINLLRQCDLKEFDIHKLMGVIIYEDGNLRDFYLQTSIRLDTILRKVELMRINDFLNAIKLNRHNEYLSNLSLSDKITLTVFINARETFFTGLDEYNKNALDQFAELAKELISSSAVAELTGDINQSKQKSL